MTDGQILAEVAKIGKGKKESKRSKSHASPGPAPVETKEQKKSGPKSLDQSLKDLAALHKNFKERSTVLLEELMPSKILGLTEHMRSFPRFEHSVLLPGDWRHSGSSGGLSRQASGVGSSSSSSGGLGLSLLESALRPNALVDDMLSGIRGEMNDMTETMGLLRMFVSLNLPSIDEVDDVVVETKLATARLLVKTEVAGSDALDRFLKYHTARARLVSKMLRFPEVADFSQSIRHIDEEMFTHLKVAGSDIRSQYLLVRDQILKNMQAVEEQEADLEADLSLF